MTNTYHGTEVIDPYQWLEDWGNPQVRTWSGTQNSYARRILDRLTYRRQIHRRVSQITHATGVSYSSLSWRHGRLFAMKHQPPLEQPLLVTMADIDHPDTEQVIMDLNQLDPSGSTTFDFYVPSPDATLVAVSLSVGGSESGDVHILETETGKQIDSVIERVNGGTAGGDVAWTRDGSGLFYTRYPRGSERPEMDKNFYQQLWFHRLGTPVEQDKQELRKKLPRIAEIQIESAPNSDHLLATVQYGDSGRFAHYLRSPDGRWQQITDYDDKIVQGTFAPDGSVFFISRRDAPRGKILRLSLDDPRLKNAQTIIEEGTDTIVSNFYDGARPMVATQSRLYVTYQLGGPSTIRCFDHQGKAMPAPKILPVSRVGQIVPLGGDDILFNNSSFIDSAAWYRYHWPTDVTEQTALKTTSPVDFSDCEVVREFARSRDGTRIPVNIIRRKGIQLDGSHPVLLTGYGGYGISRTPRFLGVWRLWIDQGGIYAMANLRGGGEFGEAWHRAGMLTRKQNVFDDFYAAMEHMIEAGYTNPRKLAILGGSNGGLLMGAMITQHPDRFQAVVSHVGIYDMLRVELSPNGAFNIPEFGTVTQPDHFQAMYAYSPYHNVKDDTSYPAVLFMTGANDPRVDPMHSRKMTARLQAVTSSDQHILLRTSSNAGHGSGTALSERIEKNTDMFAFLLHELGIPYHRPHQ